MEKKDETLIKAVAEHNDELRDLYENHIILEKDLAELNGRLHLSAEEELEKRAIQKRKLAGKDRIMEILAEHRS